LQRPDSSLREYRRQSGMYGPPPYCKRKVRMTEMVCANVFGLYWSSELLALMECAAPSSFLVTLSFKAFSGYRFSRAPGSTVVPSHVSPANLAGISNSDRRRWAANVGIVQRFPSLALFPGVICRPSGCDHLWNCRRAISFFLEQNCPGHARHLVGQGHCRHLLALTR